MEQQYAKVKIKLIFFFFLTSKNLHIYVDCAGSKDNCALENVTFMGVDVVRLIEFRILKLVYVRQIQYFMTLHLIV